MKKFFYALFTFLVILIFNPILFGQAFLMKVSSTSGQIGQTVCLDVQVIGGHDILAMQYSMTYDTEVLEFASLQAFNLPDLTASNFGLSDSEFVPEGTITMAWVSLSNEMVAIEDGRSIYQVCFTIVGEMESTGEVVFSENPTFFEVIGANDVSLPLSYVGGQVRVGSTPALSVTDCDIVTINCQDANLGSIGLSVDGGIPPYSYTWTGTNGFTSTESNPNSLQLGSYALTLTDFDNNSITALFHLAEGNASFVTNVDITDILCSAPSGGAIDLTLSSAFSYNFLWSNGATTEDIANLFPGIYTVTITNIETGCTTQESYQVGGIDELVIGAAYECISEDSTKLHLVVWEEECHLILLLWTT